RSASSRSARCWLTLIAYHILKSKLRPASDTSHRPALNLVMRSHVTRPPPKRHHREHRAARRTAAVTQQVLLRGLSRAFHLALLGALTYREFLHGQLPVTSRSRPGVRNAPTAAAPAA